MHRAGRLEANCHHTICPGLEIGSRRLPVISIVTTHPRLGHPWVRPVSPAKLLTAPSLQKRSSLDNKLYSHCSYYTPQVETGGEVPIPQSLHRSQLYVFQVRAIESFYFPLQMRY